MHFFRKGILPASLVLLLALSGCHTGHRTVYSSTAGRTYDYPEQGAFEFQPRDQFSDLNDEVPNTFSLLAAPPEADRKLMYSGSVHLKTNARDSLTPRLSNLASRFGGYLVSSNSWSTTIKVQAESLEPALEAIGTLGKTSDRQVNGQDVTDAYYDLEIRLENAQKARQRYLALLEKAQNVEEALGVERELERLNGEIDRLTGQLNRLKNQVLFSVITVYHPMPAKPGPLGYVFVGLYKGVKWLFVWE